MHNMPERAGQLATNKLTFGPNRRYAVAAVYTRFEAVEWFVWDAEKPMPDGSPDVIRQEPTLAKAVAGLE